mmetsp:Transcript_12707/g.46465  ORF Transcript_12707/g.46465 Transcript_12707/m.46465 type:complete len:230 (+) Transcript_12707:689-1378(+)
MASYRIEGGYPVHVWRSRLMPQGSSRRRLVEAWGIGAALQVGMRSEGRDVQPILLAVLKAGPDKPLCFLADRRLARKCELLGGAHYSLLSQDALLREIVPKRALAVKHLVENDARRPHVHLVANLGLQPKALRWKIPVGACALTGQLHAARPVVGFHYLAQAKVSELHLAVLVEQDVARLQVVVYDRLLLCAKMLERSHNLDKEGLRLTLRKHPVRLEMRIEVPTFTVL